MTRRTVAERGLRDRPHRQHLGRFRPAGADRRAGRRPAGARRRTLTACGGGLSWGPAALTWPLWFSARAFRVNSSTVATEFSRYMWSPGSSECCTPTVVRSAHASLFQCIFVNRTLEAESKWNVVCRSPWIDLRGRPYTLLPTRSAETTINHRHDRSFSGMTLFGDRHERGIVRRTQELGARGSGIHSRPEDSPCCCSGDSIRLIPPNEPTDGWLLKLTRLARSAAATLAPCATRIKTDRRWCEVPCSTGAGPQLDG